MSAKSKSDAKAITPEQKSAARATTAKAKQPTSSNHVTADALDALDGQPVEVQLFGSLSLNGGGMKAPTFHTGTLRAHDTKNRERRFKVGRRIVSLSTIASVKAVEPAAPAKPEPAKPDAKKAKSAKASKPKAKATETVEPPAVEPIATHSIEDDAAEAAKVLPGYIVNYVEQHGSTDAMAPMHGLPFVQAGRLYVQLEGRGGAGKKDDVAATTGLRPFLRDTNGGLGDKPKKVLQLALAALGFERAPFPYVHPDRGSTASSYYSMPLDVFPAKVVAEPRQGKRDAKRAEKVVTTANKDLMVAPVPMRPDGNEKDVKRLDELWAAYDEARETWKRAALKRASADKQAEYQQATRDANAELVSHRRAMHAKNVRKAADKA